jgi:hypothetical protein
MGGIQSTARESTIDRSYMGLWKDTIRIPCDIDGITRYSISHDACCDLGDYSNLFCTHARARVFGTDPIGGVDESKEFTLVIEQFV